MNNIDVEIIREDLVQALSQTFDDSKGLAIYGAGDTAERWFAPFLEGDILPTYFIDDTPEKQGLMLYNRPIISFEEAHTKCKSFLIILCSIVEKTKKIMINSLRQNPIMEASVCVEWEEYVFCKRAKEVLSVFDMLEDDISKATYANMILTRMGRAEQNQAYTYPNQSYFGIAPFMKLNFNEVFVDCGAYVGDTLEQFLMVRSGMFQRAFAFEPVEKSFCAMQARVERLNQEWALSDGQIELVRAGIGERSYQTELQYNEKGTVPLTGQMLSGESAQGDIPVISIDEYFSEQSITFLKVDIEGYEWKMLRGAERVIRRDCPKLAICIYHTPFDMYRIVLLIKSICPDYKFAVRQHYCDIWDTVLYAYM